MNQGTLAGVMHICAIPWPIVAPLVGLVLAQNRPFLARHSRFRLTREAVFLAGFFVVTVAYIAWTIPGWVHHFQSGFREFDLVAFLIRSAVVWILAGLYQFWNLVEGAILAYRAFSGLEPSRKLQRLAELKMIDSGNKVTEFSQV